MIWQNFYRLEETFFPADLKKQLVEAGEGERISIVQCKIFIPLLLNTLNIGTAHYRALENLSGPSWEASWSGGIFRAAKLTLTPQSPHSAWLMKPRCLLSGLMQKTSSLVALLTGTWARKLFLRSGQMSFVSCRALVKVMEFALCLPGTSASAGPVFHPGEYGHPMPVECTS